MNRRQAMMLSGMALASRGGAAQAPQTPRPQDADAPPGSPPTILLKDYRPVSIYKVPVTEIKKAKHPVVDVHCHGARPIAQLAEWVKIMDAAGVEKAVIFTGASTPERFAEAAKSYQKYPGRFDLWCGFDLAGIDQPGFAPNAMKSLEGCHRAGALGVGELVDKGKGFGVRGASPGDATLGGGPPAPPPDPKVMGPHPDDPRLDALFARCGQLGMLINVHVSDPIWGYLPMDKTNDGLMLGWNWRIEVKDGMYGHDQLLESLEKAVRAHPKTLFFACHFANLDYDLTRLGNMLDRNPNLYAETSARYGQIATIPRFAGQFFQKYKDRIVYGTDLGYSQSMFSNTFRVLESTDEHFYGGSGTRWTWNGLGLPDDVLKKVYGDNAKSAFKRALSNAG